MKKHILIFLSFFLLVSCGARTPSPATAQKIIKKHFNGYSKTYSQSSPFGNQKVKEVQILNIDEIQKKLAVVHANVILENGTSAKIQMNFLHKLPLGWRRQGWELME